MRSLLFVHIAFIVSNLQGRSPFLLYLLSKNSWFFNVSPIDGQVTVCYHNLTPIKTTKIPERRQAI